MLIQRFLNSLPRDLRKSPVILDVGSSTGEQACEFALMFLSARIFAFEARPQLAKVVRTNANKFPKTARGMRELLPTVRAIQREIKLS